MLKLIEIRTFCVGMLCLAGLVSCARPTPRTQEPLTIDTHVDIPFSYMREPRFDVGHKTPLRVDLGKMEQGGLDAAFFVIWVPQGPLTTDGYATAMAQADKKYSAIHMMVDKYPQRIRLATAPEAVVTNHRDGVLSAMIGIENAYSLGHELANLNAAYKRGARYVGLVHVGNNDLCTSSQPDVAHGEPAVAQSGITAFGKTVVQRANQLGIMVDVSHASDRCVRDVLAISTAPVIASHSSARALTDHPRNLSDDLLRAIAAKGGVVQAVAYKGFLKIDPAREAAEEALQKRVVELAGDTEYDSDVHDFLPAYIEGMQQIQQKHQLPTLDDYVDHIQHMVKVAGIDHVGIASDFDGGGGITGWMNAAETQNLTNKLRERGFSEVDIEKIWSGNLLRVWREVEDVASRLEHSSNA